MSAVQATIKPLEINVPPISFYSNEEIKKRFPILSKLELPLIFGAPEPFFSNESISASLLFLGDEIEKDILDNVDNYKLMGFFLYAKHVIIQISIDVNDDEIMIPRYAWRVYYMNLIGDYLTPVRDLYGHSYVNLTKMLSKIQPEH
jgi:hypothetical protein